MKIRVCTKILFLLVAIATMYEYWFVKGMFTAPLMIGVSIFVGVINIIIELKNKDYLSACLFLVATAALNMGYFEILSNM